MLKMKSACEKCNTATGAYSKYISALFPDFQRYPEPCQTGPGP